MDVETDRLILRRPILGDVPILFEFLGNANAMRFTQCDTSYKKCRRRVAVHEWFRRRDGYAPWTIMTKDDRRIIGWGGLYNDPFDTGWGVEIGYHFHPEVWGNGYASELVLASLEIADGVLNLAEIRAFAHPENVASQRVLTKSGFREERFVAEMNRILFQRSHRR